MEPSSGSTAADDPTPTPAAAAAAAAAPAVRVEQRSGLGNVLVATAAVSPGSVVVAEAPLLHVPHLKPSSPLYKPLQAYFEQHHIPASVVLKLLAFISADAPTQASVLACFSPDAAAFADAPIVKQARAFAGCLLEHPPVPEVAAWAQQQHGGDTAAFGLLVRVWLTWVVNAHSLRMGSALFEYASKLTHTCAAPNTAYRSAAGDVGGSVVQAADGSGTGRNDCMRGGPQVPAGAPAGVHVALTSIQPGDLLTTNYLGMGASRLASTPARQKLLQDKFLFKCSCARCTQEVDHARGIPCPSCSGGDCRGADGLLLEEVALPGWQLGQPIAEAAGAAAAAPGCMFCSMPELLAGASQPWTCDACGARAANTSTELWARFCPKTHARIEADMEGWVKRLDDSMDVAPLVRDPRVLQERVLGVLRVLGPRHWVSWRLLLLAVELFAGAVEEALLRAQVQRSKERRTQQEQQAAAASSDAASGDDAQPPQQQQPADSSCGSSAAAAAAEQAVIEPAIWLVRACQQLWSSVSRAYGNEEAGQTLGHHFTEAAQVLLQAAGAAPALLTPASAEGLIDAALRLQALVLPGLRTIMPGYSPLAPLIAGAGGAGGGGSSLGSQQQASTAQAVAAALQRQAQQRAAEAASMRSLVEELRRMEAAEGQQQQGSS